MNIADWIKLIAVIVGLMSTAGGIGVWAADQRYVTSEDLRSLEINRLDREITYIEIKVQQDEATNSERIYVESLKQQKRALEGQ